MGKNPIETVVKINVLRPGVKLPKRATPESAGLDVTAAIDEPVEVKPGEIVSIPTGLSIQLEPGYACFIFDRSGLGCKYGVALPNSVGVIDSDYRGEMRVTLTCLTNKSYTVYPGDRIAQLVIMPVWVGEPIQVDKLDDSIRGVNGFGSTGRN